LIRSFQVKRPVAKTETDTARRCPQRLRLGRCQVRSQGLSNYQRVQVVFDQSRLMLISPLLAAASRILQEPKLIHACGRRSDTAIAIDGPAELAPFVGFDAEVCGKPVIAPLLGGTPAERPKRYKKASPISTLPVTAHVFLIASSVLTPEAAEHYISVASTKGRSVQLLNVKDGGHSDITAPISKAWAEQVEPCVANALRTSK
jgi:hypothetical protein